MADLYNLDAEFEETSVQQDTNSIAENEDWAEPGDREEVDLAAIIKRRSVETTDEADDFVDKIQHDWEDVLTSSATNEQLDSLQYTRLYRAWLQESKSPELLPMDLDTVNAMREMVSADTVEDTLASVETGNSNMDSLFESVLRVDTERVKFLLADLLKRRLQKIEAHPLHMRDLTERMSQPEIEFLKGYGSAIERHFQTTVTNHFPQDVWKQIDAPDMIDEPNLDCFVFLKCLQDISLPDPTDESNVQQHDKGACLIVRYRRIRNLFLEGKVELM